MSKPNMKRAHSLRKYSASPDVATAAAFQDHFLKTYGAWTKMPFFAENQGAHSKPSVGRRTPCKPTVSLAQHYGLIEGPRPKLTALEWDKVKECSRQRMDELSPCPICKEKFQIKQKVILSCSHVFHQTCVLSFERYSHQQPCCPVCRTTDYEKLLLRDDSSKFRSFCATRIQTAFRGYSVRKMYKTQVQCPKDPQKRRSWFASKLERAITPILFQLEFEETEVDQLCREVDTTLATAKKVFDAADARKSQIDEAVIESSPLAAIDWSLVVQKALERGDSECPICIEKLIRNGVKQKGLAWLSCTHMFHVECITTFEKFNDDSCETSEVKRHLCPICRSHYSRKDM